MVYANDQWIQYPVKDLYDNLIMLAAINVAKDMYDKGQQEIKEFRKDYGDFIAASPKDLQWYDQEFDIGGFINDLYQRGIDPIRSRQGRFLVNLYINSRDYANYAMVKKTAETAKEFNKNKGDLQRAGLYNPITAELEGLSPENWDTVGSRKAFDRTSPTPYRDMATFSAPYFEGIKPIQRTAKKNGITYNTFSVTEKDLHNIADRHFNDLVNTPQGQLMYKMFLQLTKDPVLARKAFNESVVSGNLRRINYTDDYQQRLAEREKLGLERQRIGLEREKMALSKEIALIRANGSKKSPVKVGPNGEYIINDEDQMTPWLTKAIMSHTLNYSKNVIGDVRQGLGGLKKVMQSVYDNYTQMLADEAKRSGAHAEKITDSSYIPAKKKYTTDKYGFPIPTVVENEVPEQYHLRYAPAKTKQYKELKSLRDQIKFVLDDIDLLSKGIPQSDNYKDKSKYDADVIRYNLAIDRVSKYVDQTGSPTALLEAELAKIDSRRLGNVKTDQDLINYANDWYSRRSSRSNYDLDSFTYNKYLGILGASKDATRSQELGTDVKTVNLSGVVYSPLHRINISGGMGKVSDKSLMSYFDKWMRESGQNAILLNKNISSAMIPQQGTYAPALEANAYVTISPVQLDAFYSMLPKNIQKKYSKKDVVSNLGLRPVPVQSKLQDNGSIGDDFNTVTYYDVPVTGVQDTREIMQGIEQNLQESKEYYGTSKTMNEDLENSVLEFLLR